MNASLLCSAAHGLLAVGGGQIIVDMVTRAVGRQSYSCARRELVCAGFSSVLSPQHRRLPVDVAIGLVQPRNGFSNEWQVCTPPVPRSRVIAKRRRRARAGRGVSATLAPWFPARNFTRHVRIPARSNGRGACDLVRGTRCGRFATRARAPLYSSAASRLSFGELRRPKT